MMAEKVRMRVGTEFLFEFYGSTALSATCSRVLMKIGWAGSRILWLQVDTGAVLMAEVLYSSLYQAWLTED